MRWTLRCCVLTYLKYPCPLRHETRFPRFWQVFDLTNLHLQHLRGEADWDRFHESLDAHGGLKSRGVAKQFHGLETSVSAWRVCCSTRCIGGWRTRGRLQNVGGCDGLSFFFFPSLWSFSPAYPFIFARIGRALRVVVKSPFMRFALLSPRSFQSSC